MTVISIREQQAHIFNETIVNWANDQKSTFQAALDDCFVAVWDNIDDMLFAMTSKARDAAAQQRYFDAIRTLRKNSKSITRQFEQCWSGAFDRFWRTARPLWNEAEPTDADVVQTDEQQDEMLAIEGMVVKANVAHKTVLAALNQGLSTQLGDYTFSNSNNPFAPLALAYAFWQVSRKLVLDSTCKLLLSKAFEQQCMRSLRDPYQALVDSLQKLQLKPAQLSGQGKALPDRLQPVALPEEPQCRPVEASDPFYTAREIVTVLTLLQYTAVNGMSLEHVRLQVLQDLRDMQLDDVIKTMSHHDEEAFVMIGVIFDYIVEEQHLPAEIKALMVELRLPMLKIGLLDRQFFKNKEHPARRLLNLMAKTGTGWHNQEGIGEQTLFGQMQEIVRKIARDFTGDMALIDKLLAALIQFAEVEADTVRLAEQRTQQINHGRAQLDLAKKQAELEIGHRLHAFYVPQAILPLIEDGWKDVLVLTFLHDGVSSQQWQQETQLLDELIWSVQPKVDQAERQKMLQVIPEVLHSLRERLTDIGFDPVKLSELLKALQNYHIDILRGKSDIPTLQPEQIISQPKSVNPDELAKDDHTEQARNLPLGTWLEYLDEQSNPVRAKLSWKSTHTNMFVFVDRLGNKVAEMTSNGLASLLRRTTTNRIPAHDLPLMDRAMDSVFSVLKGH